MNYSLDIAYPALGVLAMDEPRHNRTEEPNEEEERQAVIDLSLGELSRWPDDTPDDTSNSKDLR